MTATSTPSALGGRTDDRAGDRQVAKIRTFTETKAGPKTTEFFLALAFIAGSLIAAYADSDDSFAIEDGWRFASVALAAYVISRGLAKLGTREPYTDEVDLRS